MIVANVRNCRGERASSEAGRFQCWPAIILVMPDDLRSPDGHWSWNGTSWQRTSTAPWKRVGIVAIATFGLGVLLIAASGIELSSYAELPHGKGEVRYLPPWTWPTLTLGLSLLGVAVLLSAVTYVAYRHTKLSAQ